jgi:hypothetical protein
MIAEKCGGLVENWWNSKGVLRTTETEWRKQNKSEGPLARPEHGTLANACGSVIATSLLVGSITSLPHTRCCLCKGRTLPPRARPLLERRFCAGLAPIVTVPPPGNLPLRRRPVYLSLSVMIPKNCGDFKEICWRFDVISKPGPLSRRQISRY